MHILTCSIVLSLFLATLSVSAATTISTNINTGGTLIVTGAVSASSTAAVAGLATLSGGFVSFASSSVNSTFNVTGALTATSTLAVSGLTSLVGGFVSNASSSVLSNFQVLGAIGASSTLQVAGLSTLTGGFVSNASSSVSNTFTVTGLLKASSTVSITGTTTLAAGFAVGSSTMYSAGNGFGTNRVSGILFGQCTVDFPLMSTSSAAVATCVAPGVTASTTLVHITPYFQEPDNFVVFTGASSTVYTASGVLMNDTIQVSAILATTSVQATAITINPAPRVWSWFGIQ